MFFPYKKCKICTINSINEVIDIMKRSTSEKTVFTFLKSKRTYFEGDVTDNGFKISRVIKYKNSFMPVIIGNIENKNYKTYLNLEMRLNLFAFVFGIIWFSGVIFGFFSFIPNLLSIKSFDKESISSLTPLFMLIFGYLLFTIPFIIESMIATNKIVKLVNGEIE